jgi:hypothetical protein
VTISFSSYGVCYVHTIPPHTTLLASSNSSLVIKFRRRSKYRFHSWHNCRKEPGIWNVLFTIKLENPSSNETTWQLMSHFKIFWTMRPFMRKRIDSIKNGNLVDNQVYVSILSSASTKVKAETKCSDTKHFWTDVN